MKITYVHPNHIKYTDETRRQMGLCLRFVAAHLRLPETNDPEHNEANAEQFLTALSAEIYPEQDFTEEEQDSYGFSLHESIGE